MSTIAIQAKLKNWEYQLDEGGTYKAFEFVLEPKNGYDYEAAEFFQNIKTMAHRDSRGCPMV